MVRLKNSRLAVEIETPGESYQGSRYDWSSFITSIVLDDKHQFAGVESLIETVGNGGKGLCGEFSMVNPPGYNEAKVGDDFIKIGVGLLKKDSDAEYIFYEPAAVKTAHWDCLESESSVEFSCHQVLHEGFAYELKKTISLKDNFLQIDYIFRNTGERDIKTQEYSHNFLSFNHAKIGKDYSLEVNYDPILKRQDPNVSYSNNTFNFADNPQGKFFLEDSTGCLGKHVSWQLNHQKMGLAVSENLSKSISKFAVYGDQHVICPELFVNIDVPAGESFTWQRNWQFKCL